MFPPGRRFLPSGCAPGAAGWPPLPSGLPEIGDESEVLLREWIFSSNRWTFGLPKGLRYFVERRKNLIVSARRDDFQ